MPSSTNQGDLELGLVHATDFSQQTPYIPLATDQQMNSEINRITRDRFLKSSKIFNLLNTKSKIKTGIELYDGDDINLKVELKRNLIKKKLTLDDYRFDRDFDVSDLLKKYKFTSNTKLYIALNDFIDFKSKAFEEILDGYQSYFTSTRKTPLVGDHDVKHFEELINKKLDNLDEDQDFRLSRMEVFGWGEDI